MKPDLSLIADARSRRHAEAVRHAVRLVGELDAEESLRRAAGGPCALKHLIDLVDTPVGIERPDGICAVGGLQVVVHESLLDDDAVADREVIVAETTGQRRGHCGHADGSGDRADEASVLRVRGRDSCERHGAIIGATSRRVDGEDFPVAFKQTADDRPRQHLKGGTA